MEAMGRLAGGIAHDFNNLLTGILGYANLLKSEVTPGSQAHEACDVIEESAKRVAELTGQLLGFARKGKLQHAPVDIHRIIGETMAILGRTIDKRVRITQRLGAETAIVKGHPAQLKQVVLNLALNARDAMPARCGRNGSPVICSTASM
jgi:two-component system cell cycle sensor histidine kinase/response regulator CckA